MLIEMSIATELIDIKVRSEKPVQRMFTPQHSTSTTRVCTFSKSQKLVYSLIYRYQAHFRNSNRKQRQLLHGLV